jgi:hypothetical protein
VPILTSLGEWMKKVNTEMLSVAAFFDLVMNTFEQIIC